MDVPINDPGIIMVNVRVRNRSRFLPRSSDITHMYGSRIEYLITGRACCNVGSL